MYIQSVPLETIRIYIIIEINRYVIILWEELPSGNTTLNNCWDKYILKINQWIN